MPDVMTLLWAIRESDLPMTDKHILMTLTSLCEPKSGVIPEDRMPSLTDLTKMTSMGRSTIARRLLAIEEAGWVIRKSPPLEVARQTKERTSYALTIPRPASPAAGLVPERDQGASPAEGPGLVPEGDQASPAAGHVLKPKNKPKNTRSASSTRTKPKTEPLFVVDEPPTPPNAGLILRDFLDYCTEQEIQIPEKLKGHYAAEIKKAVDEKFETKLIKNALASMLDDDVANRPSLLSNRLVEIQQRDRQGRANGGLGRRNGRKPSNRVHDTHDIEYTDLHGER